mgnify:CR=1 FL=1
MVLKGSCVSYFISDDFFTGSADYLFSHSLDVRGAFIGGNGIEPCRSGFVKPISPPRTRGVAHPWKPNALILPFADPRAPVCRIVLQRSRICAVGLIFREICCPKPAAIHPGIFKQKFFQLSIKDPFRRLPGWGKIWRMIYGLTFIECPCPVRS